MRKILTLIVVLWSATNVLSSPDLAEANTYNGPVISMMENLAEHTASIARELLTELLKKTEATSQSLVQNMESVVTSGLQQLSQPFQDLQKTMSTECQPKVNLEQLKQQIDSDLTKCTQSIEEIFNAFQQVSNEFKVALEKLIQEMVDLPKQCQSATNEANFSSHISCYIQNIAALNQQVANIFNYASETIIQTRQLGEKAMQEGRSCANEVITTAESSFNKILSTCSEALEQQL